MHCVKCDVAQVCTEDSWANHRLFATFNIHKTSRCWHDVYSVNWHDVWITRVRISEFSTAYTHKCGYEVSEYRKNSAALWKNTWATSFPKWRVMTWSWAWISFVRASAIPPICSSSIRSLFCVNAKPLTAWSKWHYFLTAGGSTGLLRALPWPSWGCSLYTLVKIYWCPFFTDVFLSHQINGLLCVHVITLLGRATFQIESSVISIQNSHTSSESHLTIPTGPTEWAAFLT